jgi:hypothetical protein
MARVCVPKELPAHLREQAARVAADHNPANAPPVVRGLAAFVPAERIAILNSTYWGAKGVDLGVTFLDSSNAALKAKILAYANKWGKYGNVKFRESGDGQVRLALKGDGYWSYIGTDILSIPKNDPTMTLDGFSLSTPDSEYDRVVCHEFGHTLGFPHEHERQEILSLLDVEKTVAYFQTHVGWDRTTTMQQVFTALDPKKITATAPDARSIMCYEFDGACTKSGQPIPGGNVIDAIDAGAVAKLYPLAVTPPEPPKPPEPVVNYVLNANLKPRSAPGRSPAPSPRPRRPS